MTEQYIRYAAMFIIIMMAVIDDYRRFKVSNRIIIAGMVIGVVINMGRIQWMRVFLKELCIQMRMVM